MKPTVFYVKLLLYITSFNFIRISSFNMSDLSAIFQSKNILNKELLLLYKNSIFNAQEVTI